MNQRCQILRVLDVAYLVQSLYYVAVIHYEGGGGERRTLRTLKFSANIDRKFFVEGKVNGCVSPQELTFINEISVADVASLEIHHGGVMYHSKLQKGWMVRLDFSFSCEICEHVFAIFESFQCYA